MKRKPEQNAPFIFVLFSYGIELEKLSFQPAKKHQKANSQKMVDKRMTSFLIHPSELAV